MTESQVSQVALAGGQPAPLAQPQQIQMAQPVLPTQQLPIGWSAKLDPNGRVYYQNDTTQKTQWNPPQVLVNGGAELYQRPQTIVLTTRGVGPVGSQPSIGAAPATSFELNINGQTNIADGAKQQADADGQTNKRTSSVGDMKKEERTSCDNLQNIIGICLAIISIIIDISALTQEKSGGTALVRVGALLLALLSLLINIVDFKTGDCECLRTGLMIVACLWYFKLCDCCYECYEKTSVKLLMLFNFILWCAIEFCALAVDGGAGGDGGDVEDTVDTFATTMDMIKIWAAFGGLNMSIVRAIYKAMCGKDGCLGKIAKGVCWCFGVVILIIFILFVLVASDGN